MSSSLPAGESARGSTENSPRHQSFVSPRRFSSKASSVAVSAARSTCHYDDDLYNPTRLRWIQCAKKVRLHQHHQRLTARSRSLIAFFNHVLFLIFSWVCITRLYPIQPTFETFSGIDHYINNMVSYVRADGTEGRLNDVTTLDDVVKYSEALTKSLLTQSFYYDYRFDREDNETVPEATPNNDLMLLRVHRLINSILLVQRRVAPTDCAMEAMKAMYSVCYGELETSEIKNGTFTLHPKKQDSDPLSVPFSKRYEGFAVQLPLDYAKASHGFNKLKEQRFWDRATREFVYAFTIHNAPGSFTGSVQIVFTMSPFGNVVADESAHFLRLDPYNEAIHHTDGLPFSTRQMQMIVIIWFCLTCVWYLWNVCNQPHFRWVVAKIFNFWSLLEIASYCMMWYAIGTWNHYMSDPHRINFDFASDDYQDVFTLAHEFGEIMYVFGFLIILWGLRTVEFFGAFPHLAHTSRIFERVVIDLGNSFILFAVVFMGFSLAAHLLFGSWREQFSSPETSTKNLVLWFVALGNGLEELYAFRGGFLFVAVFIAVLMVLLFNMFIAIVMGAHDRVAAEEENFFIHKPWNHKVHAL